MIRRAVCTAAGLLLALAAPAAAEEAPPFPDFTFKRIGPPEPGATRRITVQIEPGFDPWARPDPEQDAPPLADAPAMPPPEEAYGWYWAAVSPGLADAAPSRLGAAVTALSQAPEGAAVPEPPLRLLARVAADHGTDILAATVGTRVSPALVLAVIAVESAGRAVAVSRAGAVGLMQLMPDTAARFGVTDRTDPVQSIRGGVAYLDWLMGHFRSDPVLVLAGYNAGEGSVRDHAGVPPFAETRAYVPRVLAAWEIARKLCLTPPDLLSDGCVFQVQAAGR